MTNEAIEQHIKDAQRWADMQQQQGVWSIENFGMGPRHWPLLGVIEELGEMQEAVERGDDDSVKDAIGDIFIYSADLCNKFGWRLSLAVGTVVAEEPRELKHMVVPVGKLAHAQLKYEQGIRGATDEGVWRAFLTILRYPVHSAARRNLVLIDVVEEVWAGVSKRDWVANPVDAAKIADQAHDG